jgi:catechol 2,3-dioxygenase-like lactoylglutathione lyase family enzyme
MSSNKTIRGRLIDHIHIVVKDLEKSYRFYSAIFESLGITEGIKGKDYFSYDEFFVSSVAESATSELTGRIHLAFIAKDREAVDRVYEVGLAAGGKENGKPGERSYHAGYYACFWLDPDGNNIEAVYHGPNR